MEIYDYHVLEKVGGVPIDPCSGYVHCHTAGAGLIKCVEHHEIMDDTLNIHPGTAELLFFTYQSRGSDSLPTDLLYCKLYPRRVSILYLAIANHFTEVVFWQSS